MKPPGLRGAALKLARIAAESGSSLIGNALKSTLGIDRLRALPLSVRGGLPISNEPLRARASSELSHAGLPTIAARAWPNESRSFVEAYGSGKSDPVVMTARALSILTRLREGRELNVLSSWLPDVSRREAEESRDRYRQGKPLGPLDGVPFLVKDEFDVAGLPTTLGSLSESPANKYSDATPVERLRKAGAIFLGKTVLTEWGMSPLGQNPHVVMPHNAHSRDHVPGGSSTGSGVGVALGIAPIALGGDGGGSIRIPASLNGVFGLKPTFGRVSRAGDGFAGTVAHAGPLASSTFDLALGLDIMASTPDPLEACTSWSPPPPRGGFGSRLGAGVRGMRIGVAQGEWEDASTEVERACREALRALEKEGAVLVPLTLPIAKNAAPIGYFTIGCESFAASAEAWRDNRSAISDDVRLSYAIIAGMSAGEYLDAQRLRSALRLEIAKALTEVDVLALPTLADTATSLPEVDRFKTFSDPTALDAMCRFSFLGNLTGLPAGTAPVGLDQKGLPIGFQIVGDAYREEVVLGVLAHLERIEVARVVKPKLAVDILSG